MSFILIMGIMLLAGLGAVFFVNFIQHGYSVNRIINKYFNSGRLHKVIDITSGLNKFNPKSKNTLSWVSFYLSTDRSWSGKEIFDILTKYGMALNDEGLFEYRVDNCVWFQASQAIHPVTFDKERLDDVLLNGLAFFMDATTLAHPVMVFKKMVWLLKILSNDLNAVLVDQTKEPITPDDLIRIEQQLPEYESEVA